MATQFRIGLATLTLLSTIGFGLDSEAQARTREDTLAADLKWQAAGITWDLFYNYRGNVDYRQVYYEMYDILQGTKIVYGMIYDDSYYIADPRLGAEISAHLRDIDARLLGVYNVTIDWLPDDPAAVVVPEESLQFKIEQMSETLAFLMNDQGIAVCQSFNVFCPTGIAGRVYAPRRHLWGGGFGRPGFGRYPRGGFGINFRFGGRNGNGRPSDRDGRPGNGDQDGRPGDQDGNGRPGNQNGVNNNGRNRNVTPPVPFNSNREQNPGRAPNNDDAGVQNRSINQGNFRASSRFQDIIRTRGNTSASNRGTVIRGQSSNRASTSGRTNFQSLFNRGSSNSSANASSNSNRSSARSSSSFRSNSNGNGSSIRSAIQSGVRNFSSGNRGFSGNSRSGFSGSSRSGFSGGGNRGGGGGRGGR